MRVRLGSGLCPRFKVKVRDRVKVVPYLVTDLKPICETEGIECDT